MKTKIALFYRGESVGITSSHPYGEITNTSIGTNGMVGEVEIDLMTGEVNIFDLAKVMAENEKLYPYLSKWMLTKELQPFSYWENI
jgi:hypothetical protein